MAASSTAPILSAMPSASQRLAAQLMGPTVQPAVAKVPTALLWLRRDLRVADNPALVAALHGALHVVPVFIWAPEEEGQFQPGRCSRWWLKQSLEALEADFQALGSRIIYRCAPESRTALLQLVQETGAQALFFNHLYDPISMVRDNEVKAAMAELGVACHSFNSDVLYEPWEVLQPDGQPYTSLQDFWDAIKSMPYAPPVPLPVPASMPAVHPSIVGLELSCLGLLSAEEASSNEQLEFTWRPGGRGAHLMLEEFVMHRLPHFSSNRAKTDVLSTSRISPHLHYGELSTRHTYYLVKQREAASARAGPEAAEAIRASCNDFLRQVACREYSRYLSFHFPFTHERSLLEHLRACPWKWNQSHFKAWRQGRTGYPLVDAAMRELWSTGWTHNRMRVVCASFLVKNLLLPWQWGLKHYWDAQLDADLESAALGWQYCSGCLADAHPFSYMMDQQKEAARFDPSGNYVRRWLPVLSRLPNKWIHRPSEAPAHVLQDAGVELGVNYEWPIVTTAEARANVAHACSVIERCISARGGSMSTASEPYHAATIPLEEAPGPLALAAANAAKHTARQYAVPGKGMPPEVQPVPEASDEEVLSNTLAETRAPTYLAGGTSGFSGAASRAHIASTAADDVTVANDGGNHNPNAARSRRQQQQQLLPASEAVRLPQPGEVPDSGDRACPGAATAAASSGPGGGATAHADGYPASWTAEEVAAHKAGDMTLLGQLQAKRLQAEVASVSNRSRSQSSGQRPGTGARPLQAGHQELQSERQPPAGSGAQQTSDAAIADGRSTKRRREGE